MKARLCKNIEIHDKNKFSFLFLRKGALALAGIELIFLTVASMGLCFGFVLGTVLVTQGCFRCCRAALTRSQGLCCPSPHPTSEQAGGQEEWGGDTAGTADQRGIPDHMMMPSV